MPQQRRPRPATMRFASRKGVSVVFEPFGNFSALLLDLGDAEIKFLKLDEG